MLATSVCRLPAAAVSRCGPAAARRALSTTADKFDDFGKHAFGDKAQARFVPSAALEDIKAAAAEDEPVPPAAADAFAAGLLGWARTHGGVTHFTHQFHPMTGDTSEKHDAMVKTKYGGAIMAFSGKQLAKGEPDGSSFPGGDLRATHTARGYTLWDPSSFCFLRNHGAGKTLHIPAMFVAYTGAALDNKTPLLRSEKALQAAGVKLFDALRMPGHTRMHAESGVEQEFFLVEDSYYRRRTDLVMTGRTLLGREAPKGQELDDQYFGTMSPRFLEAIHDAEVEMWKLGIPQSTRHREVAPGQYEIAPVFNTCNVASDHNQLVMDLLAEGAARHGLAALFHEKPFADLNGSGKHNNWSVGSNKIGTVFAPGNNVPQNTVFLTFLAATVRAVHKHADLLRISIASASNDHRLGGHEAPPAVMSMYLGDDVTAGLQAFMDGADGHEVAQRLLDVGAASRPTAALDPTDRNRTSPFAFTGNKFEFRAVGSTQSASLSSFVLNTILSESLHHLADEFAKHADKTGADFDAAVHGVLRATFKEHDAIIFNGDNYSQEWAAEAAERGLPEYRTAPEAFEQMTAEKNLALFEDLGVLSRDELHARFDVRMDQYWKALAIEARCITDMYRQHVQPAGFRAHTTGSAALTAAGAAGTAFSCDAVKAELADLGAALEHGAADVRALDAKLKQLHAMSSPSEMAFFARDELQSTANNLRGHADHIEGASAASDWTLPTYGQMLFEQS